MMKRFALVLAALTVCLLTLGSCNEENPEVKTPDLTGTWEGTAHGFLVGEWAATLTFTTAKATIALDGENYGPYGYTVAQKADGSAWYFTLDDELKSSHFFTIDGDKLEIINGNSSFMLVGSYTRK